MLTPERNKLYRRAMSNTNRESREWLERMVKDDYVRDVIGCEYEDGNWMTVWVLTDIFTVHAYSIPYRNKCKPSYMGDMELFFKQTTRSYAKYRPIGFWCQQAMWLHRMKCWRRRAGV